MADTEFGQYKKSYKRSPYVSRLRKILLSSRGANFDENYSSKDSIGTLRSLLAPIDTSAYPPRALDIPVYSSRNLGRVGNQLVLGDYHQGRDKIRLPVYLSLIEELIGKPYNPYRTLLHEGGHARGELQKRLLHDSGNTDYDLLLKLIGEPYADSLADSLLR